MLSASSYLAGAIATGALAGFSWLGASAVRRRFVPELVGAPSCLATGVLALALLLWVAEILGTVDLFELAPYLLSVAAVGVGAWTLLHGGRWGEAPLCRTESAEGGASNPGTRGRALNAATLIAFAIAALAFLHFADGVRLRLGTGMTGFDSTWYHGPFAAGFAQSGSTWDLHFIAPQFLAWFYPANAEVFHGVGMLAFDRDVLSPLLNLGWLAGCLVAAWCIGRPFGVAPFSLALAAVALSVPALGDQAGEARNDIPGLFFLMAAIAIALNAVAARSPKKEGGGAVGREEMGAVDLLSTGALALVGLAAGLAAGTKLNFLLPAAVLVLGLSAVAPVGRRGRALVVVGLAALAGGGYWYLRNLAHTGNPLPWIDGLGPISLPAPGQALGGREAHSVLGYLTDGAVWSEWFLPGLREGLWIVWPLLAVLAIGGLLLCLFPRRDGGAGGSQERNERSEAGRRAGGSGIEGISGIASANADRVLRVVALAALAAALAWLVAPTSASGPEGMPRGFESGLRYLAPALVLGLALLPTAPRLRERLASVALWLHLSTVCVDKCNHNRGPSSHRLWVSVGVGLLAFAVALGYPVQRRYLESRYANPSFTTPGLNAAFEWSRSVSDARIATTSTRQYPLYGTDLSNRVEFVGEERPHGGFVAPSTCRAWRRLLNEGDYDYVVASRDRIETGKPPFPATAKWTEGPWAAPVLREPPTVVFQLSGRLDPSACK